MSSVRLLNIKPWYYKLRLLLTAQWLVSRTTLTAVVNVVHVFNSYSDLDCVLFVLSCLLTGQI